MTHRNLTWVSVTVWESEWIEEILRHCSNTATALQNNRAPSCPHVPSTSHPNTTEPLQRGMLQWNFIDHNQISSASVTQQIYSSGVTTIQWLQRGPHKHVQQERDLLKTCIYTALYIISWSIFSSFKVYKLINFQLLNYKLLKKFAKLLQLLWICVHLLCILSDGQAHVRGLSHKEREDLHPASERWTEHMRTTEKTVS